MQNKPSKWVSGYKHGPAASYTQITRMGLFLNVSTSKFEPLDSTWDNLHSGGMFISDDNKIYFRDETNKDIYINSNADNEITIAATSGVTISGGNLIIGTAGKGIDFSATSDVTGATSELLDDYEEGVHTMVPNTNLTLESTAAVCSYVKIGQLVAVKGILDVDAVSGTDNVTLTMPFTSATIPTNGANNPIGACMWNNVDSGDAGLVAYMGAGSADLKFYKVNDNAGWVRLTNASLAVADLIYFNITMLV